MTHQIASNPAALELRRMQMVSEVGIENNTTTIVLMPSDFVTLAGEMARSFQHNKTPPPQNAT